MLLARFYQNLIRESCLTIIDAQGKEHVYDFEKPVVTISLRPRPTLETLPTPEERCRLGLYERHAQRKGRHHL